MLSTTTKTSGAALLLLQAASFFSGVAAAKCLPACSPDDKLVALLLSHRDAGPFCSGYLELPTSTVGVTVTPTVSVTVTETQTSIATEPATETIVDETITVTVPAPTPTAAPAVTYLKRAVDFPAWLPTSYMTKTKRVSSACQCLSVPPAVATSTATAEDATTVTASKTVTVTATVTTTVATMHSVAIATVTALPVIAPRITVAKIEVLRKDTQASVGWLYFSSGPAITTNAALGASFEITLPGSATSSSGVHISAPGNTPSALGFLKESNPSNIVPLKDNYGSLVLVNTTPANSTPVVSGSSRYESDIWTVNTGTSMIGWNWINEDGSVGAISLWRVGGRLYPVGNVQAFMSATGGVSSSKYEILLRYNIVTATAP
ncbi:hypothetical protein B0T22DRAFT_485250 [Podospora appendiculata]|uniref:Uncharacterized protein n=1 Tax=Podospora appendiculata TaxID=314037 RepID=A0AAE1C7Q9_9PEZI|nr:hypothetical protein B0T22DRAFT_485250 [Podospora appendiculata]